MTDKKCFKIFNFHKIETYYNFQGSDIDKKKFKSTFMKKYSKWRQI